MGATGALDAQEQQPEIIFFEIEGMTPEFLTDAGDAGCTVFYHRGNHALATIDRRSVQFLEGSGISCIKCGDYIPEDDYYLIPEVDTGRPGYNRAVAVEGRVLHRFEGWLLYTGTLKEALWLQGGGHGLTWLDPTLSIELPSSELAASPVTAGIDDLTPGQIELIEEMVDKVEISNIESGVEVLSTALDNRICFRKEGDIAGQGIFKYLEATGFDSLYTQPVLGGLSSPNVVAVLPGTLYPDQVYLVGGHYDSITFMMITKKAPGADDNASGTVTVLEAARVLSQYSFESTIVFVAFSGEEIGLFGSSAYAGWANRHGVDLRGVINIDMDGYYQNGDVFDLDIITNDNSYDLYEAAVDAAGYFVPELPTVESSGISGGSSDHASFWARGFKAVWFFEDTNQSSPFIHTRFDTVGQSFNSPDLAWMTTQVVVATLASLAVPVE